MPEETPPESAFVHQAGGTRMDLGQHCIPIQEWQKMVLHAYPFTEGVPTHGRGWWAKVVDEKLFAETWEDVLTCGVPVDMHAPLNTPSWATIVFWEGYL